MTDCNVQFGLAITIVTTWWVTFGFSVGPIGNDSWVAVTGTNLTFGLFRSCSPECTKFETSEPKIIAARGLLVSALIVGFFAWAMSNGAFKNPCKKHVSIITALFVLTAALQISGLAIWTSYIVANHDKLTYMYNFIAYWCTTGVLLINNIACFVYLCLI